MNDILHANIFFFITSVAVIVLTILIIVALYYIIGILRNARDISEQVRRGGEALADDLVELRSSIKKKGLGLGTIMKFVGTVTKLASHKRKE